MKQNIEVSFVELGALLHEIKEQRHYEAGFDSWGGFLMEMRFSESMASKLITIYQKFILEYKVKPQLIAEAGGWTVVYDLVPVVTDKESAEEWLEKAAGLTRSAVKKEVAAARGMVEEEDCQHEWCQKCAHCGMRYDN